MGLRILAIEVFLCEWFLSEMKNGKIINRRNEKLNPLGKEIQSLMAKNGFVVDGWSAWSVEYDLKDLENEECVNEICEIHFIINNQTGDKPREVKVKKCSILDGLKEVPSLQKMANNEWNEFKYQKR